MKKLLLLGLIFFACTIHVVIEQPIEKEIIVEVDTVYWYYYNIIDTFNWDDGNYYLPIQPYDWEDDTFMFIDPNIVHPPIIELR